MAESDITYDGIDTEAVATKCAIVAVGLLDKEDKSDLADEITYNKVKELFTPQELAFLATRQIVNIAVKQMEKDPTGFACAAIGLKIRQEEEEKTTKETPRISKDEE